VSLLLLVPAVLRGGHLTFLPHRTVVRAAAVIRYGDRHPLPVQRAATAFL